MTKTTIESPFHQGEREIQARLGVREQLESVGQRLIYNSLPDQHREFYAHLPFLFVGSVDDTGRPWASVLAGRPGFVQSPDLRTLSISVNPILADPLGGNLRVGAQVGILGIDYQTRRRNRLTGKVASIDRAGFTIDISQAFGNCPQYIQSRSFNLLPELDGLRETVPQGTLISLDDRAGEIISKADNFYIATHHSQDAGDVSHGTDVSHRGGKPGFVRLDDRNTLTFPDFSGNYHFNTIGNISLNPRAGLLFIDFEAGDLLYLTGDAEVVWAGEERDAFVGAERLVRFKFSKGYLALNALPIRWKFIEYSPSLEATGSWQEVAEKQAVKSAGNAYRNYRVTRVDKESEIISSFYLEPEDGKKIPCHKAGQFLPIEIQPPAEKAPIQRTYTISNAPNGNYYRLSIKREASRRADIPPGVSSNFFHEHITLGSTIRAMSPRGKFVLDESSTRPVVLISGGVGITPMISMLEQLIGESAGCGCNREIWFVHGAINRKVQAFGDYLRRLAKETSCLNVHIRYSEPATGDRNGEDYDSAGFVDTELLKSLLPFDDYEFYLCGPPPFMKSMYGGLQSLSVSDNRIHYEFFGPAAALRDPPSNANASQAENLDDRAPVKVNFSRSGIESIWDPSKGTLLDLAESEGLRPAYSCRAGICQTCTTRIVSGEVDYVELPMSAPDTDEALICCAYPRSGAEEGIVLEL